MRWVMLNGKMAQRVLAEGIVERTCPSEFISIDPVLGTGVYALILYGEVVYIGKAKRLLHRIYAHKNLYERTRKGGRVPASGPFAGIKAIRFNQVAVYPCKEVDLDWIEKAMIEKYRPKHNVRMMLEGRVSLQRAGFDFAALIKKVAPEPMKIERRM